jgi:hypothetical protein
MSPLFAEIIAAATGFDMTAATVDLDVPDCR